jgi:hypothetical protein
MRCVSDPSSEAGTHRGTVLFSFEGADLEPCDADLVQKTRCRSRPSSWGRPSILENCIEKNIHVPNMKSGPHAECGCNFEYPKFKRVLEVHKSTQVDTLAPQAMKDVASCDKLGGAANEQ